MSIKQFSLMNFHRIREPERVDGPNVDFCSLGVAAFGMDEVLCCEPLTRSSLVHITNEMLDEKLNLIMSEMFAENAYNPTEELSAEDHLVLSKYINSIVNIGDRYQIGLPLIKTS